MYSVPAISPSPVVTVPAAVTFGPNSVPKPPLLVKSTNAR